jgi:hypothetical protein
MHGINRSRCKQASKQANNGVGEWWWHGLFMEGRCRDNWLSLPDCRWAGFVLNSVICKGERAEQNNGIVLFCVSFVINSIHACRVVYTWVKLSFGGGIHMDQGC